MIRDAGEPLAQHPARAALGHGELELQSAAPVEDNRGEIGVILSVCVRFHSTPQFHYCYLDEPLRALGGNPFAVTRRSTPATPGK